MSSFSLHLPKRTVTVKAEIKNGRLTITDNHKIWFQLSGPFEALFSAPKPPPTPAPRSAWPVVTDLTGDPHHDWLLFVKRFHGTPAADVLPAIAAYYKNRGYAVPGLEAIQAAEKQLEVDVISIRSILPDIIENGQLKRGARSRIAQLWGVRDAGNYRPRINAVIEALLADANILTERIEPDPLLKTQKLAV
jgi:hypothetical protein